MNVLTIKRNVEGLPVALRLQNGSWLDDSVAFFAVKVGELTDGSVELKWGDGNTQTFPLDTHADDNGVNGAVAYAELVRLTTHTEHPHTDISPAKSLGERINGALLSIANIFGRLESVEKALATLGMLDDRRFVKWVVRGTEFQCEMANVDDGLASFDLKSGFDGFSQDLNPDDPNDTRQLLQIKTRDFGMFNIITARQELGRIRDAVNANAAEAVHSEPLPKATPDAEAE